MPDAELLAWAGYASWLGVGLLAPLLLAEGFWPRAQQGPFTGRRWRANLATFVATALTLRWLPQLSLVAAALVAQRQGWGLFNVAAAPEFVAIAVSWLAIDLSGYLVHRAEHASRLLWRIHRVHHSDPDVDVTTTYRFHPFEVLLRAVTHVAVAILMGAPLGAVVGYLLLSAVSSPFSHANVRLPAWLEQSLGWIVITPGIHRTHHSLDAADSNTNFAVSLSVWDRLFGTFRAAPARGWDGLRFGLQSRSAEEATTILRLLADPFLPELDGAGDGAEDHHMTSEGTA